MGEMWRARDGQGHGAFLSSESFTLPTPPHGHQPGAFRVLWRLHHSSVIDFILGH